jgi:hypothetical protein
MPSWTPQQPGLGDPEGLRLLALEFESTAEVAELAEARMRRVCAATDGDQWKGKAATAFRDRIGPLPGHLGKLAASYLDAASGVRAYAEAVEFIDSRARSVHFQLEAERARLDWALGQQTIHQPPGAQAVPGLLPGTNPFDRPVEECHDQIAALERQLADLAQQRQDADSAAVRALNQAHDDGMHNASGWSHAWHRATDDVEHWAQDAWHEAEDVVDVAEQIGDYYVHHPLELGETLAGIALAVPGGVGALGGLLASLTGAGAVVGVPVLVVSSAMLTGGLELLQMGTRNLAGSVNPPDRGDEDSGSALDDAPQARKTGKAHPSTSKGWQSTKPGQGKTRTNGLKGSKLRYYEWDYTHGDIEVYNGNYEHLGSADPDTLEMIKPPKPGRTLNNKKGRR